MTPWTSAAALLTLALLASAQPLKDSEAQAKRLVVMLMTDFGAGSGIVIGADAATIYIATARHVVEQGGKTSEKCAVRFFDAPQIDFAGTPGLLPHALQLDVAVVRVARNQANLPSFPDLPFDRMSPSAALQDGDPVHLLGNRPLNAWRVNLTADKIAAASAETISFESNFIGPGHSGGALIDRQRRLIGLLVSDQPPDGRALSLDTILQYFKTGGVPVQLRTPGPWIATAMGRSCRWAISGEVYCWESQEDFKFDHPDLKANWVAVGANHICLLDREGEAQCGGLNKQGQLGTGDTTDRDTPAPVAGGPKFSTLTAGWAHTCGVTTEGKAFCWGAGSEGRLGNDSGDNRTAPQAVSGNHVFRLISAGMRHTCGITASDALLCWGGVLGTGKPRYGTDPPNAFTPVPVATAMKFRQVAAGGSLTCAITTADDLYCWKTSDEAELDEKRTVVIPQAIGKGMKFATVTASLGGHACGITRSGEAFCWGVNSFGQLGNGTETESAVPVPVAGGHRFTGIAAGGHHTCAIRVDGSTCCWGGGDGFGPTNQPKPVCVAGK